MNLIKEIKKEVNELDLTPRALRKGSATLGITLVIVGVLLQSFTSYQTTGILVAAFGAFFTLVAVVSPLKTIDVYKIWMTFAFTLGWFVSKIIFTIIFYLVVAPVGMVAKLFGKEFLDLNFNKKKDSYWIKKQNHKIDYEKMH